LEAPVRLAFRSYVFVLVHVSAFQLADAHAETYRAVLLRRPHGFNHTDARDSFGTVSVGQGGATSSNGDAHALLWLDAANEVVDLHPDGFASSFAVGASDDNQAGWGNISNWQSHAFLWRGSAQSAVDLHPSDYRSSVAYDVFGNSQVGWGLKGAPTHGDHALLWNGTAESAVDLHPAGHIQSRAYALSGNSQVGYAIYAGRMQAAMWNSSAASFVNLNPIGFKSSIAMDVEGNYQVGSGRLIAPQNETHALLWQGSSAGVVDLHPAGFQFSHASDVSGNTQVGFGNKTFDSSLDRALLWQSTAASVIDLHQFLDNLGPSFMGSRAFNIDANGDVIGHAIDQSGQYHAVRWTLIPEPHLVAQLSAVAIAVFASRKRRSK
jgi:hypothetical protein